MIVSQVFTFVIFFLYFLVAIFFAFYIPGNVLLARLKLVPFHRFTLSLMLGMVLWGWQGFVFGFLNVRFLSYVYLAVFFLLWIVKARKKEDTRSILNIFSGKKDPLLVAIIALGVLIQTSIVWFMGIRLESGLYFCCGAIGDFIYHLRLTDAVISQIPPFEPDMYGQYVHNYHYLGNIVAGELVRVFRLPLVFTQFQYMGLLLSLFFGLCALIFAQIHKLSQSTIRWLLFFLYFGGDFIYIVILALGRGLHLEMGPLENGAALLNNPPRAFAAVVFFAGLCFFSLWVRKKDIYTGILMALVFASLVGFKIYFGIFALSGLAFLCLYAIFKKRWYFVIPILLTLLLSLLLYFPVNKNAGGLNYVGFWRFEEFIVQPALGLSHLELARQIFATHFNWVRVFLYDFLFMFIFVFSIFGPKLIGLFQTRRSMAVLPKETHIVLICGIAISSFIGFFFWQQSGGSNSFNFLVTVYIIGSIYAAIAAAYWFKKIHAKRVMVFCVLIFAALNVPRIAFEEYKNIRFIQTMGGYLITNEELHALEYVRNQTAPSSILFVTPNARYQTFLGKRNIYLGDFGLLGSHDVDTSARKKIFDTVTAYKDPVRVTQLLTQNNITYLYVDAGEQAISTQSAEYLEPVFTNKAVKILKVR